MGNSVVAASDGLVYRSDGAVYVRDLPGGWREISPIPGTDRAREMERERSGMPGLPHLKEAS